MEKGYQKWRKGFRGMKNSTSCMTGYIWANLAMRRKATWTPMTKHTLTLDKDMKIHRL